MFVKFPQKHITFKNFICISFSEYQLRKVKNMRENACASGVPWVATVTQSRAPRGK